MQPRYYRSTLPRKAGQTKTPPPSKNHHFRKLAVVLVLLLLVAGGTVYGLSHDSDKPATQTTAKTKAPATKKPTTTTKTPATTVAVATQCSSNSLSQLALVSISQRHMWACEGTKVVYDSPVVTGMEFLAADLTPTGTYHIASKETNVTLSGSDSTGSWNDPVSYWMTFLYNQYGTYGFHDATWRADSAFGNIDPNTSDASHGCVELPLATAKWLYNWAPVGTTVTIES